MKVGVCEPVEGRSMQESVCESGESVWGLSLRALHARAGGDHLSAQVWTNFGTTWDQLGTNPGPIWDQFGTNLGPMWEHVWDSFGERKRAF